jgi:GNAT superfamily N-acetyltransferase
VAGHRPGRAAAAVPRLLPAARPRALAAGILRTTPRRDAAALWLPAGPGTPDGPGNGSTGDYDRQLAAVTGRRAGRFRFFDQTLDARHPPVAHWHLAILAVHPRAQGHGTGTALLRAGHQMTDADRLPCYLEASDRRTRRLYLRHGYGDHGMPLLLPDGPLMYPMVRDPRPPAGPAPGPSLRGRPVR